MESNTLSLEAAAVLDAIIHGPRAWATLEQIVEASGLSADDVTEVFDSLTGAGLIEPWPAREAWTLTPLSAARLNLEIKISPCGVMSWGSTEAVESRPRPNLVAAEKHDHLIATLPDRRKPFDLNLAFPTVVLTGSATVWVEKPGRIAGKHTPKSAKGFKCETCRGARLPANMICLRCQNWGLDHRLRKQQRNEAIHKAMTAREKAYARRRELKERALRRRDTKIMMVIQEGSTTYEAAKVFGLNQSTIFRAESRLRRALNSSPQVDEVA